MAYDGHIIGTHYMRPYGFQIRVAHRLLPKVLWATFDSRDAAEAYMHQLEGLLAQGIVPQALLERASPKQEIWTVRRCVFEYLKHNAAPYLRTLAAKGEEHSMLRQTTLYLSQ